MLDTVSLSFSRMGADTLPSGRSVELPGRGTTYVYDQPGPPGAPAVVLVHGLAASGALNWFPAFGPLSQRFRVLAVDLRGHGRGIPVRSRFRLSECADDIAALADELEIERFIGVGYSLGGPVTQLVWHRHRDRVAGLVQCATSRNFGGTARERWFYTSLWGAIVGLHFARRMPWWRAADAVTEASERASADRPTSSGMARPAASERDQETFDGVRLPRWAMAELRRCSPATLVSAMSAMGRFSSHEWIGEIDVPTAVVVTTRDRFVAPSRQLKLARAIPGATIHPAHTDHAACVLGARRFIPALLEACESVVERTAVPAA